MPTQPPCPKDRNTIVSEFHSIIRNILVINAAAVFLYINDNHSIHHGILCLILTFISIVLCIISIAWSLNKCNRQILKKWSWMTFIILIYNLYLTVRFSIKIHAWKLNKIMETESISPPSLEIQVSDGERTKIMKKKIKQVTKNRQTEIEMKKISKPN